MRKFRQKYYDFFSPFYDRFISMHSSGHAGALKSTLAAKTGISAGDRVLDICTGTGSLLPHLKDKVGDSGILIGLDFSRGMLNAARAKFACPENVYLIQADVAHLPFKKDVFDAATCAHAFYELRGDSQDTCLRDIRRILKLGRPFLMMEHDVPRHPIIRILFYIRLLSMGFTKAFEILKHERNMLQRYFSSVDKLKTASGRSKIFVCTK